MNLTNEQYEQIKARARGDNAPLEGRIVALVNEHFRTLTPETPEAAEYQLRERVRQALHAYRDHYAARQNDPNEQDPEHVLVSKTQIDSAMRLLWMDCL
jgi:hypothetical protein